MTRLPFFVFAGTATALLCASAIAQPKGRGGDRGHRRGPPAEALQACEGLSENDSCAFESDRGTVEGICRLSPEGQPPLACAPEKPPRG